MIRIYTVAEAVDRSWVYDWQTLIAGVLALSSAGLTSWFLWRQIKQTQMAVDEDLQRQLLARRVRLAVTLDDVSSVLKKIDLSLSQYHSEFLIFGKDIHSDGLRYVNVDGSIFVELSEIIPLSNDRNLNMLIRCIIHDLQVLSGRLESYKTFSESLAGKYDADPNAINGLQFLRCSTLVSILYEYARFRVDRIQEVTWEEVAQRNASVLNPDSSEYKLLSAFAECRIPFYWDLNES